MDSALCNSFLPMYFKLPLRTGAKDLGIIALITFALDESSFLLAYATVFLVLCKSWGSYGLPLLQAAGR